MIQIAIDVVCFSNHINKGESRAWTTNGSVPWPPVFLRTTTHFSANSAQNSRKSAVFNEPSADFSSFPRYVIIFYLIYCIFGTDFEVKLPNLNQFLSKFSLKSISSYKFLLMGIGRFLNFWQISKLNTISIPLSK